jgi:hypothetical protein
MDKSAPSNSGAALHFATMSALMPISPTLGVTISDGIETHGPSQTFEMLARFGFAPTRTAGLSYRIKLIWFNMPTTMLIPLMD